MREEVSINEGKQEILDFLGEEEYKPLKFNGLSREIGINKGTHEKFKKDLKELVDNGEIIKNKKGQFTLPGDDIKVGIFSSTQKGFGFLVVEGEEEDIFIPGEETLNAFHGDKVMVEINDLQTGRSKEGKVVRVIERSRKEIVGTFQKSKNFGFVIADNSRITKDFFIPKEHTSRARTGDKVVVSITDFGGQNKNPEGRVIEVLGRAGEPGVDIMSVIKGHDLPVEFPKEVSKQLKAIPDKITEEDRESRRTISNLLTITIDGEDAKDLDDAITISKKDDNYVLGVHIADVTHYVREGTALDTEAYKRGTSVYLINKVIPMLPPKLSNGICSLNVGEDRLALSCFMTINKNGEIVDHKIEETVINVDHRLSYTYVAKVIEGEEVIDNDDELLNMINLSEELAGVLKAKRQKRGSINFDFPESIIILDENGVPTDIKSYDRNVATKIIEEFMLITNEVVGENYFWQEIPFLYRTHEVPDSDKIRELGIFINNFGYTIKTSQEEIHPKELQSLLDKVSGKPEEALISRLTLRSMKQARYSAINTGHFGLSAKYYSHFTAPIRRYPDLQIHRIIKEGISNKLTKNRIGHYNRIINKVADHSSKTERRAEDAEREVDKLKKVQYMGNFIGETFEGVISSITSWGIYTELPNTVEGMTHVNSMDDDYYNYDAERYQMVGEHSKKTYKLGQKLKIKVKATDMVLRTIDFEIVEVIE